MPIDATLPRGLAVLTLAGWLAGCQAPGPEGASGGQALQGGTFENAGGVIEEPGVFRIANGQNFTTPFSVDCTKLNASVNGWQDAVAAGAHHVMITVPGQPRVYGGVLALCKVDPSATGPSSRFYSIVIPDNRFPEAADGLIASVAEKVAVNRAAPINFAALLVPTGQPALSRITEDYAWMLWMSDRPAALGVSFASAEPPPPVSSNRSLHLVKDATYTVASPTSLYTGASRGTAVLEPLKAGDTVTASGSRKGGYWKVTATDGQTGWMASRSLSAN